MSAIYWGKMYAAGDVSLVRTTTDQTEGGTAVDSTDLYINETHH